MYRSRRSARRGVAAVELALVFVVFMLPLMIGVWEVGRLIQVQQIVSNSAREGARLAAQGYTINTSGSPTRVMTASGTVNVTDAAYQYLVVAGLSNLQKSDVQVDFQFLAPRSDGQSAVEPHQGEKGQPFSVTVTVKDWAKVRWVSLGLVKPAQVKFTVTWQMLMDNKFTINQDLPTW